MFLKHNTISTYIYLSFTTLFIEFEYIFLLKLSAINHDVYMIMKMKE